MNSSEEKVDKWEQKLEEELLILKQCQSEKNLKGCDSCEAMFECEIRKKYVVAVYESMNKGSSGGFEF